MMKIVLLILAASNSALAKLLSDINPFTDEYIDYINSKQKSWTARRNFPADTNYKSFLNGVHEDAMSERLPERKALGPGIVLDKYFDAREAWPDCDTINEIRDQSNCEGCWAFAPVEVISDRICIHSDDNEVVRISPQELIECCPECANFTGGCRKGSFCKAWHYWEKYGLVTGGNFNDNQTCLPFGCPPCHFIKRTCPYYNVPECKRKCQPNYEVPFYDDKYKGAETYAVPAIEEEIMREIMINGPVQTGIRVYEDFHCYSSGVYYHIDDRLSGHHALKIIGWGEERGKRYWLVANSQGKNFGKLGGFVKILRGYDESGIESHVHAGIPEKKNRQKKIC